MAKPTAPPPGFDELTVDEQLDYLMDLWGRISVRAEAMPARPSHLELAAERLAAHRADPSTTEPAAEVLAVLHAHRDPGHWQRRR